MLRFFRAFSKSWFGPLIMGAVTVAFVFLGSSGIRNLFGGRLANAVVQAGDHTVTVAQFQKVFEHQEQAYLQQNQGQPFPLEDAVRQGFDQQLVQKLAAEAAYFEMLARSGIRPSDDVVASEVRRQAESGGSPELAQLFDSVTGKFNPQLLQRMLGENGLTFPEFQRELTDSIADQDFSTAVRQGFEPPRIYSAIQATLLLESRDVSYFVIPAASVPQPPAPTDAQLQALIDKFRDRLMLPERRKLTIVRFSAKALAPTMPVDPAAVQQEFDAKKATYGKPELRSLVEIPLNDPSKADQVIAALRAGQDPAAVARSVGVDAVTYADQPESAIADRKAGDIAFQMTAGQVSGAVQGDFKTVVIKVIAITPGQAPDFNAAKPQIIADLQMQEAIDKIYDLTQKFDDLVQGGMSLQDAATKLGLTSTTLGPVTADGKDITTGQPNPILSPKLLTAAFQLQQGADSDGAQQDADKGEYFYVHVDQVVPPSPPALTDPGVRPELTQAYYAQALGSALQQKAADAEAALAKGQTLEAVAATYHAQVAHQLAMTRAQAQQLLPTLGQDFLAAAFDAKPNTTFTAGLGDQTGLKGFMVGHLDAVRPGDPAKIAEVIEVLRQRSAQPYLDGLDQAVREAAVQMISPQTDLQLARDAMGVDAAMVQRATRGQTNATQPAH